MRIKKLLVLLFVFGMFFIGCDFVSDENETSTKGESSSGGTTKNYLSESVWTDGKFSKDGQIDTYYISVNKGVRYFIYMNNAYGGDRTKTAQTGLKISHSDGTIINDSYNNVANCWAAPYTFVAPSTGTITITAASYYNYNWERGTGTYAIKYTSRSEYDVLSEGEWKNDNIIANGQTNKYSINVTFGMRYSIWLNDAYEGDGSKTANRIGLTIMYSQDSNSDNPVICNNYNNAYGLYAKPYTFTAPSTGTIIVTAASYYNYSWEKGTGTYAIKYTSTY